MAGKCFEELEVGMTFDHAPGRTVAETDNLLFSTMTLNPQPLHLDAEFAASTQHGQILVNSEPPGLALGTMQHLVQAIDTAFVDIQNTDALATECQEMAWMGYTGKITIHPSQIDVVNAPKQTDGWPCSWRDRWSTCRI